MNLREFTEKFAPLPDAFSKEGNAPVWRKAFPTNLRWRKIIDKAGYYRGFLSNYEYVNPEFHLELEEEWERTHKGEVIDREWRKVYIY